MPSTNQKYGIHHNGWYSREDIKQSEILGENFYRLGAENHGFLRRRYHMLEVDEEDRIKGDGLLRLREKLDQVVNISQLAESVGIDAPVFKKRYEKILAKYLENIFPEFRKGYPPLYIRKEQHSKEEFMSEIEEIKTKEQEKARKEKIKQKNIEKNRHVEQLAAELQRAVKKHCSGVKYRKTTTPVFEYCITAYATALPLEVAVAIEEKVARRTGYAGRRYIDAEFSEESVDSKLTELHLERGKESTILHITDEALRIYCRAEGISQRDFKGDKGILASQLETALESKPLQKEMKITTRNYEVEIEDGKIVGLRSL